MNTQDQELRPPYVEFVTRVKEDRSELTAHGTWAVRDVIVAKITRPGQKDTVEREAEGWILDLRKQAADNRIPHSWPQHFSAALKAYKEGLELPVNGVPIKGWGLLTPAQQETVVRAGIKTVEDLAAASAEAIAHVGMGGIVWRDAAKSWLAQGKDKGAVAQEVADLKRDNAALKEELANRDEQLKELVARVAALEPPPKQKVGPL